jgi:Type IV secretion-system coupling protein DNA-binding domain
MKIPYFTMQLISWLIMGALIWFLFLRRRVKKPKPIESKPFSISETAFKLEIAGEWRLQKNNMPIVVQNPFRGILITGSVGSGKSKSIIEPIIEQAISKGFTGILYDYESPVLTNHFYSSFKRNPNGVQDFYINFHDLTRSHRLNPLNPDFLTSSAFAREYSHTILGNLSDEFVHKPSFWTRSSESLLAATIWFLKEKFPDHCSIPHVVSMLLTTDVSLLLKRLSESEEAAGMVASIQSGLSSNNQTAGIISTLQNALASLNTPNLFWVLSGNDLTLDLNNPESPKFLCVANTPSLASTYGPLISVIFSAALKQMNQQGMKHSAVIIDELPTVYIPNLDRIPATARKNKIATVLCVQDFSQMEDRYGDKKTEVITSVLVNQLFGKTTNPKTAERISKLYGRVDTEYWTESHGTSGSFLKTSKSSNRSQTIQERPKVKPQEIVNLETGQFYGSLSDSWKNEFKASLREMNYEMTVMPPFVNITQGATQDNYKRIKLEAQSILQGESISGYGHASSTISFDG